MNTDRRSKDNGEPLANCGPARKRRSGRAAAAVALCLFAGLAVLSVLAPVAAHSWYPRWCCNNEDCVKVDTLAWNPDGTLHLESGAIKIDVPKNFRIQPSEDGDAHMCVYRDMMGRSVPRCIFLPGTS